MFNSGRQHQLRSSMGEKNWSLVEENWWSSLKKDDRNLKRKRKIDAPIILHSFIHSYPSTQDFHYQIKLFHH
ncbi:hypothetical protein L6452_08055 [Arctium lappa]|uniref:Uncharacterized protein n=1 Tax=Arctium lappa TaxID=4217 RepID=A0ACB9DGH6_ARCLA|nr:hypothetical protein L6452_08055 [Arctium lappa]